MPVNTESTQNSERGSRQTEHWLVEVEDISEGVVQTKMCMRWATYSFPQFFRAELFGSLSSNVGAGSLTPFPIVALTISGVHTIRM